MIRQDSPEGKPTPKAMPSAVVSASDDAVLRAKLDKAAARMAQAGYAVVRVGAEGERTARPLRLTSADMPTAYVSRTGRPLRRDQVGVLDRAAARANTVFVLADPGNLRRRLEANGFLALHARLSPPKRTAATIARAVAMIAVGAAIGVGATQTDLWRQGRERIPTAPPDRVAAIASMPSEPGMAVAPPLAAVTHDIRPATAAQPVPANRSPAPSATVAAPPPAIATTAAPHLASRPPPSIVLALLPERPPAATTEAVPRPPATDVRVEQPLVAGDMPGIIVRAKAGDTLQAMYHRTYGDASKPTFEEVSRLNPEPVRAGSLVFLPEAVP